MSRNKATMPHTISSNVGNGQRVALQKGTLVNFFGDAILKKIKERRERAHASAKIASK